MTARSKKRRPASTVLPAKTAPRAAAPPPVVRVPLSALDRAMNSGPGPNLAQQVPAGWTQGGPAGYGFKQGPPLSGAAPASVHEPAAAVLHTLRQRGWPPVDHMFRKLPEASFFQPELNPSHPRTFQIGTLQVPKGMMAWITDYEFSVWRLSGTEPGDGIKAGDGEFSTRMGFDVSIEQERQAELRFELDPEPIVFNGSRLGTAGIGGAPRVGNGFAENSSRGLGPLGGAGNSLLPARSQRYGPREGPFTLFVREENIVGMSCTIFRRLTTPIAFIQAEIMGWYIPTTVADMMIQRIGAQ